MSSDNEKRLLAVILVDLYDKSNDSRPLAMEAR